MGLFKRTRPVPEWAPAFKSGKDVDHFERLVRDHFRSRGLEVEIDDGYVRCMGSGPYGKFNLGLTNPGQTCAGLPRERWPEAIEQHFTKILQAMSNPKELPEQWQDAAERLCVRLWDKATVPDLSENICREDIPGLVSVLMFDEEQSIRSVGDEWLGKWGVDADTAFGRAVKNLPRHAPFERMSLGEEAPAELVCLSGESPCVASWLLDAEEVLPRDQGLGVLVSVPTRDTIVACPLTKENLNGAVGAMIVLTHSMHENEPGGVSPRLYWRRGGGPLIEQGYELGEEGIGFRPTAELMGVLDEARGE